MVQRAQGRLKSVELGPRYMTSLVRIRSYFKGGSSCMACAHLLPRSRNTNSPLFWLYQHSIRQSIWVHSILLNPIFSFIPYRCSNSRVPNERASRNVTHRALSMLHQTRKDEWSWSITIKDGIWKMHRRTSSASVHHSRAAEADQGGDGAGDDGGKVVRGRDRPHVAREARRHFCLRDSSGIAWKSQARLNWSSQSSQKQWRRYIIQFYYWTARFFGRY